MPTSIVLRQRASSEWTRLDEIARKKLYDTIYERLAEMITDGIIQCLFDRTQNEAICSIDTVLRMPGIYFIHPKSEICTSVGRAAW